MKRATRAEKNVAVTKYKEPANVCELSIFLGLTSYFRKFVKNYAHIYSRSTNYTHDLYGLLKKNRSWEWNEPQQAAFDTLNALLTERRILALYNPNSLRRFIPMHQVEVLLEDYYRRSKVYYNLLLISAGRLVKKRLYTIHMNWKP